MICVPDDDEVVEGFGHLLHWPCMEAELVVGDPLDAVRTHVCPEVEHQSQNPPLRLVPDCRERSVGTAPDRQSDHRPVGATTGGTSRPNRLSGEATQ